MAQRPTIVCNVCGDEKSHAAAGMCYGCYKDQRKRRMDGAYKQGKVVERGLNGRPLCRWCKKEVPKGRRTFCNEECIHEWSLRTSPQYVRIKVFERDHGICAMCGIDTVKMEKDLAELFRVNPAEWQARWDYMMKSGWKSNRRHGLWDADHIEAVVDGGGMKGLNNYRTLCVPCHKGETKKLQQRRAVERREEKKKALEAGPVPPAPPPPPAPPEPVPTEVPKASEPQPAPEAPKETPEQQAARAAFDLIADLLR